MTRKNIVNLVFTSAIPVVSYLYLISIALKELKNLDSFLKIHQLYAGQILKPLLLATILATIMSISCSLKAAIEIAKFLVNWSIIISLAFTISSYSEHRLPIYSFHEYKIILLMLLFFLLCQGLTINTTPFDYQFRQNDKYLKK